MDGSGDFVTVKSLRVHFTKTGKVCAQLITIKGEPYIGLQRTTERYNPDGESGLEDPKPYVKSIYLPVAAWDTLLKQALPALFKEARQIRQPAKSSEKAKEQSTTSLIPWTKAVKRSYPNNGIVYFSLTTYTGKALIFFFYLLKSE